MEDNATKSMDGRDDNSESLEGSISIDNYNDNEDDVGHLQRKARSEYF